MDASLINVCKMYGPALPDEVLKKLYYKNALRIIPEIDRAGEVRVS